MTGNNIFIVTVGDLYEGGHVRSVHATLEGAKGAVSAYLSEEEELNREAGPDLDPDFRWHRRRENFWANCVDFIRIDAHQVLP